MEAATVAHSGTIDILSGTINISSVKEEEGNAEDGTVEVEQAEGEAVAAVAHCRTVNMLSGTIDIQGRAIPDLDWKS